MKRKKIVIAITGASGSIYASRLIHHLQKLKEQYEEVAVVCSSNAGTVWEAELNEPMEIPFRVYGKSDFMAPFASGSARFTDMVIVPCSMGTLGRIAAGISDDLITRAADVMLKERRRLVCVIRETPLNLIQIRNMEKVTEAGGIILPASPSFYSRPVDINTLADTVVARILDLIQLDFDSFRWKE